MKHKITIFAFVCLYTLALAGQNNFSLEIHFDKAPAQTVSMETFDNGWFQKRNLPLSNNSVSVDLELKQLEFFRLSFNPNVFIVLIALPGDKANISVDVENIFTSIEISGSPHTILVYSQEKMQFQLQSKIDSIIAVFNGIPNPLKNAELTALYQSKIDSVNERKEEEMIRFLKSNTSSPSALFFIERLDMGTSDRKSVV